MHRGCLWNSFVMVGQLSTVLGLFLIALPELYLAFKKIRPVLDTTFEQRTIERLYFDLDSTCFSEGSSPRNVRLTWRCFQFVGSDGATSETPRV